MLITSFIHMHTLIIFRLLTMPSGERIQFGPNVNFLFESHDLSCASPATISRMGMIFLRYVHMHVLKYKIVCIRNCRE